MTVACTSRDRSAYETGRLAHGDGRVFRPGGPELTARAVALARLASGARVLDLGCGAGDTVRDLRARGFDAIGVDCTADSSTQAVDGLRVYPRVWARAEALPFADATMNAVLAECSVSLFEDREQAFAECRRVLVDGGRLMITDLYARQPEAIAVVRALRGSYVSGILVREELEASLGSAGFTVDVFEDHSRALRECAARFLFEFGSLDGMWGCSGDDSAQSVQATMRAARAGYFLLVATLGERGAGKGRSKR